MISFNRKIAQVVLTAKYSVEQRNATLRMMGSVVRRADEKLIPLICIYMFVCIVASSPGNINARIYKYST